MMGSGLGMVQRAKPPLILVVGAGGYVGSRLVPMLLHLGYRVRAASRCPTGLQRQRWSRHPRVELVTMDLLAPETLVAPLEGVHAVYFLAHSMERGRKDFAAAEIACARNMATAAARADVARILYLGGLGGDGPKLSRHLASRHAVGAELRQGPVPVTELRAAMIIGNGSAGFEILRYLVERLPIMVTPPWVRMPVQPIAIRDALTYLTRALESDACAGRVFDIGGPDVVTYRDLFRMYADQAKLGRRVMIPLPLLSPRLSGRWIPIVTPVPSCIARPLAEGLSEPVVCRDFQIRRLVPIPLMGAQEAIRVALAAGRESLWQPESVEDQRPEAPSPTDAPWAGGTVFSNVRLAVLHVSVEQAWRNLQELGRGRNWHGATSLWRLRGLVDAAMGGAGPRVGREGPGHLMPGQHLDSWRIQCVLPPHFVSLRSEFRMPGEGVLRLELESHGRGCLIRQRVLFRPRGVAGILYWVLLLPSHLLVFHRLFRAIEAVAAKGGDQGAPRVGRGTLVGHPTSNRRRRGEQQSPSILTPPRHEEATQQPKG